MRFSMYNFYCSLHLILYLNSKDMNSTHLENQDMLKGTRRVAAVTEDGFFVFLEGE